MPAHRGDPVSAVMGGGSRQIAFGAARERLRARWRSLGLRERRLIAVAGAVIGLFLLWTVALGPALGTLREAPPQLDQLDAQLQQMRRLAAEARELRGAPVVGLAQSTSALQSATARLGDRGRLQVLGDRATLTLVNASGEQLRRWLAEARSGARARPVEATLTRNAQGLSGSVVVSLPSGGAR